MYTYKCENCDAPATDYLVKFNDPIPACRACGSTDQAKQISANTSFCLMGKDWSEPGMSVSGRK